MFCNRHLTKSFPSSNVIVSLCFCVVDQSERGFGLNKKELIGYVAEKAELNKKQASAAVEAFIEGVSSVIERGDKISLIGFGTFGVKERAAREGVVPGTKEKRMYDAKKVPFFKAGKALKDKAL